METRRPRRVFKEIARRGRRVSSKQLHEGVILGMLISVRIVHICDDFFGGRGSCRAINPRLAGRLALHFDCGLSRSALISGQPVEQLNEAGEEEQAGAEPAQAAEPGAQLDLQTDPEIGRTDAVK